MQKVSRNFGLYDLEPVFINAYLLKKVNVKRRIGDKKAEKNGKN
jgi:hypothetical protein